MKVHKGLSRLFCFRYFLYCQRFGLLDWTFFVRSKVCLRRRRACLDSQMSTEKLCLVTFVASSYSSNTRAIACRGAAWNYRLLGLRPSRERDLLLVWDAEDTLWGRSSRASGWSQGPWCGEQNLTSPLNRLETIFTSEILVLDCCEEDFFHYAELLKGDLRLIPRQKAFLQVYKHIEQWLELVSATSFLSLLLIMAYCRIAFIGD